MVRGKKMGLGEFLGDQTAAYIPEAALPSGPRIRSEDDDGGYGGGRGGGRRGFDREPSRSEQSDQWRGDRGGDRFGSSDRFGDRGGDRFGGDRFGGDRFGRRGDDEDRGGNWRGGGRDGPSRYDRPSRDEFREPEERPAHMRLNLQRRTGEAPAGRDDAPPRAGGDDKWSGAFGRGGGGLRRGGDDRFGGDRFGGDRFGDRGGDRFGDRGDRGDRFGGDRFGDRGDRFGDRGSRFGGDRFGDRGDRFGRDDRDSGVSSAFNNLRVSQQPAAAQAEAAPADKKTPAQQKREERKKKAEEERKAAEEAKRKAAEEKARAKEEAKKKAEADREIIKQVLASGKKGEALAAAAKAIFAEKGQPGGGVVVEAVTAQAADVAKASANWIALPEYGELLKLALADTDKKNQLEGLYALQVFLNGHDFPKGLLEKCFMALYSLDIIEDAAFFEYKYDVDSEVPGRMKAIIQTSTWLTWLETPESESEEEDDE